MIAYEMVSSSSLAHAREKMTNRDVDKTVRDIRRVTQRKFSAEEKIRIALKGLRAEYSIAELCRREGIAQCLYYKWSKEFLEAGKKLSSGDTERQATSGEVKDLRRETADLKEALADVLLENRLLRKARSRREATIHEIPCIRNTRDHSSRRAVAFADQTHTGQPWRLTADVLSLARSLASVWRNRS